MIGSESMAKTLLNRVDVADLGVTKALAGGLAEIERAQAEAVRDLADAHGFDLDVQAPDPEQRKKTLLDGADAATDGRGVEWWIKTRWGHRLADPAATVEYAGMDPDEWDAQIGRWAEFYRENGLRGDRGDRDLAALHVRETFGVEIDWFEREIVGLDRAAVLRELLAGNLEAIEHAIRDAAEQTPDTPTDE